MRLSPGTGNARVWHFALWVLGILILVPGAGWGQTQSDTVLAEPAPVRVKKGSIFSGRPGKSMLLSLALPGTGQIYNKSYLRVPFVYAAVGGMTYVLNARTREYNCLRDAYIAAVDQVPYVPTSKCPPKLAANIVQITDPARLRILRDQANSNRQLAIVGFTLVWLANGIDAFVDAHLKEFDIDDNLTLHTGLKMSDDPFAPVRYGIFVTLK